MEIQALRDEIHDLTEKVEELYIALIGSKLTKDGGVIKRVDLLESDFDNMKIEIETLKKKNFKLEFYQKIAWVLGGSVGIEIIRYLLESVKH